MYFGNMTLVTAINIRRHSEKATNTFRLLHSVDGINWELGETVGNKV